MPGPKAATGTINRFLSRREKDGSSHERQKSRDKSSDGRRSVSSTLPVPDKSEPILQTTYTTIHAISANSRPGFLLQTRPLSSESMSSILFLLKADPQKKLDKEQAAKVDTIQRRLAEQGYMGVTDDQITYALASKHAGGDVNLALELLVLFQESVEGVIKPYDPDVRMLGAENRGGATCYLDTVLFSMFARLPSFEPILYTTFEDEPRRRLSTLIRLWVNMLRTGKLIQIDITEHLQDALAACGWEDAKKLEQQDTSEAFHFITEKLQLPLLTLKMDIYHTGREDDPDDHKFVQERLLAVAVPEENHSPDGRPIKLEDCLEDYFNNRIEVRRQLERSNTLTSIRSGQSIDPEKGPCSEHVEELAWSSPNTPITALPQKGTFPASDSDKPIQNPESPTLRHRSESIIRTISLGDQDDDNDDDDDGEPSSPKAQKEEPPTMLNRQHSLRKGSVRKEVLMPAWQFYNLLPWYTKHAPSNNAEVAEHFSQTQPVLGICLKRYYMDKKGKLNKTTCAIDVPLDIKMPHFVPDEMRSDDEPLMGNYKMSLQSFICHQGNSLNSGHYKCFVRVSASADGDSTSSTKLSNGSAPPIYPVERWIKFDDLGTPRVSPCDIEQVLKEETPYLLFYQVQPTVVPVPNPEENPPSYSDSGIQMKIDQASPAPDRQWEDTSQSGYFDVPRDENGSAARSSTETKRPRASLNLPEDRRSSVATDGTLTSSAGSIRNDFISAPSTPSEESTAHRMSRAAARFTKFESKSRPSSQSGENRISATFSRLALMRSKESLNKVMQINKDKGESTTNADSISENRKSSSLEETVVKAPLEGTPTKKEKAHKRDKSKGATEKLEHPENRQKGKWKDKDVPDRECGVM